MRCSALFAAAFVSVSLLTAGASAQVATDPGPARDDAQEGGWDARPGFDSSKYGSSGYEYEAPTPRQIIQHKAQMRALSRIRRLETMAAYGMSNARPAANPTPTGMYSPGWQMPGGRPHGWYTTRRSGFYFWR